MISKPWTKQEVERLKQLIEDNHTKFEISNALGRTINAIMIKTSRLGLAITNQSDNIGSRGRDWRDSDIQKLKELWSDPTISMNKMCKELKRSKISIKNKVTRLKLGGRSFNTEYLSITDICNEMQVSPSRISNWIKLGLKTHRSKTTKSTYMIDVDDLLDFLENHKDIFDASLISEYLFIDEPQWLIDKRKEDAKYYPADLRLEYGNEDDKVIQHLFYQGKSDEYIAKILKRTPGAIARRRRILSLLKDSVYTEEEIEIIKKWSRYKTLDELSEMLVGRSPASIEYKCWQLKIPYHFVKSRCEDWRGEINDVTKS